MKNYIFAAFFLGSYIAFISAGRESFDFIDSQGRCWRCTSGSCTSCPASILPQPKPVPRPQFPFTWDRTCPGPTEQDCIDNPIAKFPADDINFYWDCAVVNGNVPIRCECDKGFDMGLQRCVYSDEMTTVGCEPYTDSVITPCPTPPTEQPPTEDPGVTTTVSSTSQNPCVCIPFWPCRCNPCWHMPCRSCNGCGMMMG